MLTRLRAVEPDAGLTLLELMVGMVLLSIVTALSLNFFLGTQTQSDRVTDQTLTAADGRAAMNAIVTALRLADTPTGQPGYSTGRFQTITASEITFFSNIGNRAGGNATTGRTPPMEIDITATGSQLVEKTYAPKVAYTTYPSGYNYVTNYPSAPTSTVVLLDGFTSRNVFSYSDGAGAATNVPDSVAMVSVSLSVPALAGDSTQVLQSGVAITGALT